MMFWNSLWSFGGRLRRHPGPREGTHLALGVCTVLLLPQAMPLGRVPSLGATWGAPAGHFQRRSGVVWCPKKPRSVCGKEGGGEGFWKLPLRGPFPGEAPGRGCPRCLLCCGEAGDQRCLLGQPHLSGCLGQLAFPRSPPLALRPPAQWGHQAPQFPSVPGGPKVAGASLCLAPW